MATTLFATTYVRLTGAVLLLTGLAGVAALATGYIGFLSLDFLAWDQAHNVLHIVLGLIALYVGFAPRPVLDALTYCKVFGVVYTLLALAGFASLTLFGLGPALGLGIELGENLIHLLVGVLGLVAGFYVVEGEAAAPAAARSHGATTSAAERRRRMASLVPPTVREQPIENIEGIGPSFGKKLRAAGVTTIEQLLLADGTDVARRSGLREEQVAKWTAMGQLQAINGVGPQYSELLVRTGIRTLADVAEQTPSVLLEKITAYQESLEVRVQGGTITVDMLKDWIHQARDIVKEFPEVARVGEAPPEAPGAAA